MEFLTPPEWAVIQVETVIREISKDNGKIKNIIKNDNLLKIMSKFTNCIRYDIISPTDNVTYRVPFVLTNDIDTFIV
jgi:hypothetical protein